MGNQSSKDRPKEFDNREEFEKVVEIMLETIRKPRPLTNIAVLGGARDGKSSFVKAEINAVEDGPYQDRPECGDSASNITKEIMSYPLANTNVVLWDTSGMQKEHFGRNDNGQLSIFERVIQGYAISGETVLRDVQGYMISQPQFNDKPESDGFMHGYFCAVRAQKDFSDDKEAHDFLRRLKEAHDQEKLSRRGNDEIKNEDLKKFNISRAYVVTRLDMLENGDEFKSEDFYNSDTMNRKYEEVRSTIGFDSGRVHRFRHLPENQMDDLIRKFIILRPLYKMLLEIDRERAKYPSLN